MRSSIRAHSASRLTPGPGSSTSAASIDMFTGPRSAASDERSARESSSDTR